MVVSLSCIGGISPRPLKRLISTLPLPEKAVDISSSRCGSSRAYSVLPPCVRRYSGGIARNTCPSSITPGIPRRQKVISSDQMWATSTSASVQDRKRAAEGKGVGGGLVIGWGRIYKN